MAFFAFILNLPWSIMALFAALVSLPQKVTIRRRPFVIFIHVRSFWWKERANGLKGVRATTSGNVVLLGKNLLPNDIEHELVHIAQYRREPFVHPFCYMRESRKHGYRNNKYEVEAYQKAQNRYVED